MEEQPKKKSNALLIVLIAGIVCLGVIIVIILSGGTLFALNPSKQLADTRNAQRDADINTILNTVYQYAIDNNGNLPPGILETETEICGYFTSCTDLVDLSVLVQDGYLVSIPMDPLREANENTGYWILQRSDGRVIVSAPLAEEGAIISVTR